MYRSLQINIPVDAPASHGGSEYPLVVYISISLLFDGDVV